MCYSCITDWSLLTNVLFLYYRLEPINFPSPQPVVQSKATVMIWLMECQVLSNFFHLTGCFPNFLIILTVRNGL